MLLVSIPWLGTPLRHKGYSTGTYLLHGLLFSPSVCYLSGPYLGIEIDQNGGGDGYLQAQT